MQSLTLTGAAILLATLLTACDRPTGPADSTTPNTATPAFAAGSKSVDGELVTLTGEEMHVFNGVGPDVETGNFTNFTDFFKFSATGVGESGTQYVFYSAEHFTFESPSPEAPQVSFTFKGADFLVSKGAAANFTAHVTFHITLTPNGFEVVTTFDRAECQG